MVTRNLLIKGRTESGRVVSEKQKKPVAARFQHGLGEINGSCQNPRGRSGLEPEGPQTGLTQ
jgi:hypothetical protein